MTPEQRRELRELAEKATPGPWEIWTSNSFRRITGAPINSRVARDGGVLSAIVCRDGHPDLDGQNRDADLAFIAASRTAVPELLDENDALRAELAEMRSAGDETQAMRDRDETRAKLAELTSIIAANLPHGQCPGDTDAWQTALRQLSTARADLIRIRRTNELLTRENIKQAGRIKQLEGGDLVAALMTDVAVRDARVKELEAVYEAAKTWRRTTDVRLTTHADCELWRVMTDALAGQPVGSKD